MWPLEITLRIHRNLAIPALELPKVSAKTELGAGAAEGLGLRTRSAILVVRPSLAGAGPGAEPHDCDGACDEDLAGGDHRVYGTRDAEGDLSTVTGLNSTTPDGKQELYTLDSQGRPISIVLADNSRFLYDWSPSSGPVVTAISGDGTTAISAPLNTPQSAAQNAQARSHMAAPKVYAANASSSTSTCPFNAHVTSCNGKVPEDYASVVLAGLPGGMMPYQLVAPGTGTYCVSPPSGPVNMPLTTQVSAVKSATSIGCGTVSLITNTCTAITLASVLFPSPLSPGIIADCAELDLSFQEVSAACNAITGTSVTYSVINYVTNNPPALQVLASMNSDAATSPQQSQYLIPSNGTFPNPNVDFSFQCPPVDHVTVYPPSVTIYQGQEMPMTATAKDANNNLLFSSAFNFTWSSDNVGVASVNSLDATEDGALGSGLVTGVAPGNGVNITATETSSSKTGTSSVTVQPVLNVTGLWSGSYTWDQPNGQTVGFGILINQQNVTTLTGVDLCFSDPYCFSPSLDISGYIGQVMGNIVTLEYSQPPTNPATTEYYTYTLTVSNTTSPATMTGRYWDHNNPNWGTIGADVSLTFKPQ